MAVYDERKNNILVIDRLCFDRATMAFLKENQNCAPSSNNDDVKNNKVWQLKFIRGQKAKAQQLLQNLQYIGSVSAVPTSAGVQSFAGQNKVTPALQNLFAQRPFIINL